MLPIDAPIHIPYCDCAPLVFPVSMLGPEENCGQFSPMFRTGIFDVISRDNDPVRKKIINFCENELLIFVWRVKILPSNCFTEATLQVLKYLILAFKY